MKNRQKRKAARPLSQIFGILAAIAAPLACAGQSAPAAAPSAVSAHPIPLHHLYRYFLRYQAGLDQRADALEKQGRFDDAARMRSHLQKDLSFTDEQIAIVRQAGLQLKAKLDSIQSEARPIIGADRQWLKLNGRSAGPPPGASQVHELQKQQETAMLNSVAQLNLELGPEAGARLEAYVDAHVTGHTSQNPPPRPKTGAPFQPEARQ
jgi:hypothetical protein